MPQGLLPQDVVVLAKLVSYGGGRPPIAQVAGDLALSPSQVHASLKRLERSRLIDHSDGQTPLEGGRRVSDPRREIRVSGSARRGHPWHADGARGFSAERPDRGERRPAAGVAGCGRARYAAPRSSHCTRPRRKPPGRTLSLHELLALIDALRDGRVRERQLAEKELSARLRRLLRG